MHKGASKVMPWRPICPISNWSSDWRQHAISKKRGVVYHQGWSIIRGGLSIISGGMACHQGWFINIMSGGVASHQGGFSSQVVYHQGFIDMKPWREQLQNQSGLKRGLPNTAVQADDEKNLARWRTQRTPPFHCANQAIAERCATFWQPTSTLVFREAVCCFGNWNWSPVDFHTGIQRTHVLVWQLKLVTCWLPHWYSAKPCAGLATETGHLLTSTLVFSEAMCWFGNWNWSPVDFHTGIQRSHVLVWQLKLVTCWLPHWYSAKPCAGLATETGHLLTSTLVFSEAMCWFGNWNWSPVDFHTGIQRTHVLVWQLKLVTCFPPWAICP